MYFLDQFRGLHRKRLTCQKPAHNLLSFKIFFLFFMNCLPHILRDLNMLFADLFPFRQKSSSDKYHAISRPPPGFTEQNRQTAPIFFVTALRLCSPVQEGIYIVLNINSVIPADKSYLTYILRQFPFCGSIFHLLLFIFIDDLYHIQSPLQASE